MVMTAVKVVFHDAHLEDRRRLVKARGRALCASRVKGPGVNKR